jgi:hypothetical protein
MATDMTEVEWQSCESPTPMLYFMRGKASMRKFRLVACGCCRRIWSLLGDERSRNAVEVSESYADKSASREQLLIAQNAAMLGRSSIDAAVYPEVQAAVSLARPSITTHYILQLVRNAVANHEMQRSGGYSRDRRALIDHREAVAQVRVIHDAFGNPFQTRPFDPRWRTSDVVGLARAIYEDRSFERVPMLGDALMDAGCSDQAVLGHCRSDDSHVRGCWLVDAILEMV